MIAVLQGLAGPISKTVIQVLIGIAAQMLDEEVVRQLVIYVIDKAVAKTPIKEDDEFWARIREKISGVG